MKANFFYVVAIIVIAAITLGENYKKVKTVKLLLENVEALAWGEGPGDEDHRRDQAVNCPEEGKGAWNVKTGCCWGYTTCRFEICEGQSGC